MAKEKKIKVKKKIDWKHEMALAPGYIIVILWVAFTFMLLGWIIAASLSTTTDIFAGKALKFPSGLHFENYMQAWGSGGVATFFTNSLLYAVVSCVLLILICAPAAYVLARYTFIGNKIIQTSLVSAMGIPITMIVLPLFGVVANLGILNNVAASKVTLIFLYVGINIPYTTIFLLTFFANISSTYEEAAAYIEEIPKFTKKHTLEHTKLFLKRLGNPAVDRKIVHVAGTNGKGSVCAYLQAILMAEGKRTGFFTSPHLVSVNERIRMDNVQIDNKTFLEVFRKVLKTVRRMVEDGIEHPSYFEFLFGMGMTAFAETDVEYIILETGLGGRLDATNAVEKPVLSIITSISLDHTAILGDTIRKIAVEKAGIIKPKVPVFFDGSNKEAAEVIRTKGEELGVYCREVTNHAYEIREVHRKYIAFSRRSAYDKDVIFQVPMCGCYQAMNAELALEASEYLLAGEEIHMERWKQVLAQLHWEGRMERIGAHITVDGAHNPGAMQAFVESVKALDESERGEMILLFSAVSDKKYDEMIEYLCGNLDVKAYIVTQIEDERGVPVEELADIFRRYTDRPVYCKERLEDAVRTALDKRGESGEIYCLGSLYLVGMIKKLLAGGAIDA